MLPKSELGFSVIPNIVRVLEEEKHDSVSSTQIYEKSGYLMINFQLNKMCFLKSSDCPAIIRPY